jgi:hypothetical protein
MPRPATPRALARPRKRAPKSCAHFRTRIHTVLRTENRLTKHYLLHRRGTSCARKIQRGLSWSFPPFPMGPSSLALHVSFVTAPIRWTSRLSNQASPPPLHMSMIQTARFSALLFTERATLRAHANQTTDRALPVSCHPSHLEVEFLVTTLLTLRVAHTSCILRYDNR